MVAKLEKREFTRESSNAHCILRAPGNVLIRARHRSILQAESGRCCRKKLPPLYLQRHPSSTAGTSTISTDIGASPMLAGLHTGGGLSRRRNAKEQQASWKESRDSDGGTVIGRSVAGWRGEYDMNQHQTPKWNINNVTMRLPSLQHGRPGDAEFVP
ncbi:hypothetical protein CBL_10495 [Carabus blaptoides fortunei]